MKRALVVVDVQNEYFSGLLPITHCACGRPRGTGWSLAVL